MRLRVRLRDGSVLELAKSDYEGFHTRPMSWQSAREKFGRLAARFADAPLRRSILGVVGDLESRHVAQLTELLGKVGIRRAA